MDNVRFQHANEVEHDVNDRGYEMIYLPPYSPFPNPIENMFNQLKFYVKRTSPANADAVFPAVGNASHCIVRSLLGEPIMNRENVRYRSNQFKPIKDELLKIIKTGRK